MDFPVDNAYSEARWRLGRRLFYDPIMSKDSSISCASCHLASYFFSDTLSFSPGVDDAPGTRNAPSLVNVGYHPYFTREGGVATLEMQVLIPIQEHNEFDFNILLIADRMREDPVYQQLSYEGYDREPDYYVISRALGVFERTLVGGDSAFDQYAYQKDKAALSAAEIRGMDLFFSDRTNCSSCHSDFNFTNYAFENNGLYAEYPDPGRFRLTGDSSDLARFKVPSIRNIAHTAPFMHDGSLPDLMSVVKHYNSGGFSHPNKSPLIRPLGLTASERIDLLAFLNALTDENFNKDERFSNPF